MAAQTNQYLPATSHLLTGLIVNGSTTFSLAAGVPTGGITLGLDNSATNANWMTVRSLTVASDDTTARIIIIGLSPDNGTTFIPIGAVNVPIQAGTKSDATVPIVDLLNNSNVLGLESDLGSNRVITIPTSCKVLVGCYTQVTSGKALYFKASVDVY